MKYLRIFISSLTACGGGGGGSNNGGNSVNGTGISRFGAADFDDPNSKYSTDSPFV